MKTEKTVNECELVAQMDTKKVSWILQISGLQKLVMSACLAIFTSIVMIGFQFERFDVLILSWNVFASSLIVFNWILFFSTNCDDLCLLVKKQDDGLKVIFVIVIVAICFSVFSTLALLNNKNGSSLNGIYHTVMSLSPVLLSWILLHTIFVMRYAHLYHDHDELNTGSDIGGIVFPTQELPDYLDFAYMSFVIGMTFQVSDVVVSSRVIRRLVLMHSLISFVFNTIIVALTINAIAGLNL